MSAFAVGILPTPGYGGLLRVSVQQSHHSDASRASRIVEFPFTLTDSDQYEWRVIMEVLDPFVPQGKLQSQARCRLPVQVRSG
jgi:hypothetical protein